MDESPPEALRALAHAHHDFRCLAGNPVGHLEAALAHAPRLVIAQVFKGYLYALATEPGAMRVARACAALATRLVDEDGADPATLAHRNALQSLVEGRWRDAARLLAAHSRSDPLDSLALQVGHQIDFFVGDTDSLHDRVAAAHPAWDASMPGYHAILGMLAFGLGESGRHEQAERLGREAVALQAHDSWAWHAVAHTFEMRGLVDEGIAWLAPHVATWSDQSLLATHLHWHLALFHLDRDDHDAVLSAWDAFIGGTGSSLALNLVDASSLLWRLHLRGVDVGARWGAIADRWTPLAGAGNYAFNDLHAMLAFCGARRSESREAVRVAQRRAMRAADDNAAFTAEVGAPATEAIIAFEAGDYRDAVRLLLPLRECSHRFGGSRAQRDLLELTLLEAALRAGIAPLARQLATERRSWLPRSPLAGRLLARANGLPDR